VSIADLRQRPSKHFANSGRWAKHLRPVHYPHLRRSSTKLSLSNLLSYDHEDMTTSAQRLSAMIKISWNAQSHGKSIHFPNAVPNHDPCISTPTLAESFSSTQVVHSRTRLTHPFSSHNSSANPTLRNPNSVEPAATGCPNRESCMIWFTQKKLRIAMSYPCRRRTLGAQWCSRPRSCLLWERKSCLLGWGRSRTLLVCVRWCVSLLARTRRRPSFLTTCACYLDYSWINHSDRCLSLCLQVHFVVDSRLHDFALAAPKCSPVSQPALSWTRPLPSKTTTAYYTILLLVRGRSYVTSSHKISTWYEYTSRLYPKIYNASLSKSQIGPTRRP
jgi:hypothetical protein